MPQRLVLERAGIQIATRPFKAPLYPWLPLAFALNCAYVLYASLAYVRIGAVVGVVVLLFGVGLAWALEKRF